MKKSSEQKQTIPIQYGKKTTRGIRGLFHSFHYAFSGFVYCVRHERNMRIHLTAVFYVFLFSTFYGFTKVQYAVLAIVCGLVIVSEMVNTSIEAACDLFTREYSRKARIAKDVAAGAVFICACIALVVGGILFFDLEVIQGIFEYFQNNLVPSLLLLASFILAYLFVKERD